ncbi:uncharacterized protein PRCAT00004589001 [Priceomyces carsonii]|uniref:uncharacterized protein n=1 Tax=Priceomyces carsonii TaxID=28549 RepID=UPI002EDB61AC|nr:unnamed protein product [Priceomyces carsonii]
MSRNSRRRKDPVATFTNADEVQGDEGCNKSLIPFSSPYCMEPHRIIELMEIIFEDTLESPNLQEHIQMVKGKLYEREYISAFDGEEKRLAYASRWTPARALSYSSLFATLAPIRELLKELENKKKVLCVGGGAGSELVGLSSVFCRLKEYNPNSNSSLEIVIADIADWSSVVTDMTEFLKQNWLYNPAKLNTTFMNNDVLDESSILALPDFDLLTILFTTNELFSEKKSETIKFLHRLNSQCKSGCYLLIAESAGSYSHITVGTKTFPVQFLIDTILLGRPGQKNGSWRLIEQSDSCWYRIDTKEINYTMKLENMRFFYRLYQKN